LTVLTKADKLSRGAGARQRQVIGRALGMAEDRLVTVSVIDGRGINEIWGWLSARTRKAKAHVE
jgi:class 3 adenylate cyclase